MASGARHGEISIHTEDPGLPTVQQILAMMVEELPSEMQARSLPSRGAAKPHLKYALFRSVAFLPLVEPTHAAASVNDASMGTRFRTCSGQSNSGVELQLQLRRLELEFEEKKQQREQEQEKRNQEKICNNTITKDPTASQVCRYTTLLNVKCLKNNNFCTP